MTAIEHLKGLWGISLCSWGLIGLYAIFRTKFIVKRYEKETDLLKSVYFQEHYTFSRYLPPFLSSGVYAMHLLMCVWWWKIFSKKKIFRDIKSPEQVTRHFTKKEIQLAKRPIVIGLIVGLHAIAFYIFKYIWPEHFQ